MKRIKLVLMMLMVFILSGCTIYMEQDIKIKDDNSGRITQTMYFEESMYDMFAAELLVSIDEFKEQNPDVKVSNYEEEGFKGFTLEMEFDNLDELGELIASEDILFEYTINDDDTVDVQITYLGSETTDGEMGNEVFYEVTIDVPKIIDHNAEDVSWGKMYWDFSTTEDFVISFSYTEEPLYLKILKGVGITLVVSGVGFGGFLGFKKYKLLQANKQKEPEIEEELL